MKTILIVFKELKEAFRDKRTVIMTIILPTFLIPIMLLGQFYLMKTEIEKAEEREIKLAYEGPQDIKMFLSAIDKLVLLDYTTETNQEVEQGNIHAALVIRDGEAVIYFDPTKPASSAAMQRIKTTLLLISEKIVESRLLNINVDPAILRVFEIKEESVVEPGKMGAYFAAMLIPLMILSIGISGNMYLFSDIGAGEKERGTLEPLLATPVNRSEVALGKWLAVSVLSFVSILLMLVVMIITIKYGQPLFVMEEQVQATFSLTPLAMLVVLIAGLLLSLSSGALQFAISIYARNIREAQLYLGYLPMIVILPVVFIYIVGIMGTMPEWAYFIPLINIYPVLKDAMMNEMVWNYMLFAGISNLILVALGIIIVVKVLEREDVVLRT
ncbi:MAG: ABC transporter permease protein NatB [candidate division WS2 bacterium]|uniref:ABC transporter permease protein NatB n=1 Tax=Psychracetigena formicireducens TaxID=2986056 RepID=A0A9E2BGB2_PSYF1|nr:ABC transporter permease protein NatB [Candidatus Psychracetigena formicireducens]MBT9145070.1 ABC transporter permease protein NatB [Candidatus Psychracetigena formicireducens]